VIEPTDEMREAFERAFEFATSGDEVVISRRAIRAGLAAVLALVERDFDVSPKLPPFEHRMVGTGPRWNHYMNEYTVECTCGATFGGRAAEVAHGIQDHIERNTATPPQ
jgi:hypothetical protein